jgi:2-phosphosulfolactate phosphatase
VIDVLRASSSIVTALANGAREIVPASSVQQALKAARKTGKGKALLCGERQGLRVRGFDLGNSPLEFTAKAVKGKVLHMASTNGTKAIAATSAAIKTYIACFLNVDCIAQKLCSQRKGVSILCAGKEGLFSLEDFACAGMLVFRMECREPRICLNDAAHAAYSLYKEWCLDLRRLLETSGHGQYLREIGMGEDLIACAQTNRYTVVPVFQNGRIGKAR